MTTIESGQRERVCRFPGCARPAAVGETGRPPEYCDDAAHTRAAAWRERRRRQRETSGLMGPDEARPVDAARQRAGEIRGQVAGMVEHLQQQMGQLLEELRTLADPEATEAQIEAVSAEAAEQVAAANGRASRAEQAQRTAQAERVEADAAAAEATEALERAQGELETTRAELGQAQFEAGEVGEQLRAAVADAEEERGRHHTLEGQWREELADAGERLVEVERERDAATGRTEEAVAARAAAEEQARTSGLRAETETARATHAEQALEAVRAELDQVRERDAQLRSDLAVAAAERDAARADVETERRHADQRVADLQAAYERQLEGRQDELERARAETTEVRSRLDRAEAGAAAGESARATSGRGGRRGKDASGEG